MDDQMNNIEMVRRLLALEKIYMSNPAAEVIWRGLSPESRENVIRAHRFLVGDTEEL